MTSTPSRTRGSHRRSRRFRPALSSSLVDAAPQVAVGTIFRRFWPETRGFRLGLLFCFLLVMLMPALDGAVLWLFMILIDDVLTPMDLSLFPWVAAAYLAITVAHGVVSFGEDYMTMWVTGRFLVTLRTKVFAHLHRLSVGFFERRQLGDVLSRLSGDINAIEDLVVSGVAAFLSYLAKIVLFTGVLFVLNWKLALIALVAAPVFAMASRYFSTRMKDASREERRCSGALVAVAQESLSNVALVQAYDRADDEVARFHREGLGSFRAQLAATRLGAIFTPLVALLQTAGVMVVIGFGVWELVSGNITLGGLLVFVGYLSQLFGPIRGVAHLYNSIYTASAGAERVLELLDAEPLVAEPAEPVALPRATGTVALEGVAFRYPGADRPALTDISFTVAPGQKVAVVGASGAGKSTLAKMLLRAYDPDSGRIRLDGVDLRDLSLTDLRANVVAVLQETLVFDGSIRENILWGRPGADVRDMVRAAVAADADPFITALPEGYDTRVGQRGRMLSGGQLQRLAIARAMIRDAPVLLLDEPTTGLDAASTQRIMAPLRRLMAGRTTIVISHNLLTVTDADQILFLDGGRITGTGTHEELMTWHPEYGRLYHLHHRLRPWPAPAGNGHRAGSGVAAPSR